MLQGRITEAHRTNFIVTTEGGVEYTATVRGVFHAEGDFPKVGDYVKLSPLSDEKAVIEEVLPRTSVVKRKAADSDDEQIIAANVDTIFIVMGLDGDFNVSRLERYLLLAQQSAIPAIIILNKSDTVAAIEPYVDDVVVVAGDTRIMVTSALSGVGMKAVQEVFAADTTAVLLGSSGAGKSTITNWLLDQAVQAVFETRGTDNRGRHTTTTRQLFVLPQGGFLIDTPGMRELGVFEGEADDESVVFEKIEHFASLCQYRNCDHEKSQGCAVLTAVESGEITDRELRNYHKILRERLLSDAKGLSNATRFGKQNDKRAQQKQSAAERQRLSRR